EKIAFPMLHAGKARLNSVVIRLRNRIKFVIMAACATDREPEKCAAGGTDHIMEFIGTLRGGQDGVRALHLIPGATDEKSRGCILVKKVAGNLFDDKPVVGFVLVESSDDIIAISPGCSAGLVHFEAMRFREPDHVEPMPGPAFAVLRGPQQLFDD